MYKEKFFENVAKNMDADKILIICDRGAMDAKAYMGKDEFLKMLEDFSYSETNLRDSYDAVFHLVTAANGAEEFYSKENNAARTETPEEARIVDKKIISVWSGHQHFRVIDNQKVDFNQKITHLISEIAHYLGEPEPYEIERKYLIKCPDIHQLESIENCTRVKIVQTYLNSGNNDEVRVRRRGENGDYVYTKTVKRTIDGMKRVKIEKRISKEEYLKELANADPARITIEKDRYCFIFENQYWEVDIFSNPEILNGMALLEVELRDEYDKIHFPNFIEQIKDVTYDSKFKNASLALKS